jgi:hypothetical protein
MNIFGVIGSKFGVIGSHAQKKSPEISFGG